MMNNVVQMFFADRLPTQNFTLQCILHNRHLTSK
ncbi:UNVERIFIED_CONTAM: hypothetical protein ABID98_004639 [Brevibacillus sp. OAP136]